MSDPVFGALDSPIPSRLAPPEDVLAILQTKLLMPHSRQTLVERKALQYRLNQVLEAPLTLIVAPAGYGKTTALSAFCRAQAALGVYAGWVSLDAEDNDPIRFWSHVLAALEPVIPALAPTARLALRQSSAAVPRGALRLLLNALCAQERPVILALDDVHHLRTPEIYQGLSVLVEQKGANLHLILAGREDPPLQVARLRAGGGLLELKSDALMFSPEESQAFLEQTMVLHLEPADASSLAARAEGWPVGLQLAALWLKSGHGRGKLLDRLSGEHPYVMDYLMEEVLAGLPESVRTFLLQTSILERLCGELCGAVTLHAQAQTTLELLERAQLFTVPLDESRRWYRYHALFAEALRSRLKRERGEECSSLHLRAAVWYEGQGLLREAVAHALAGEDVSRAAALLERAVVATRARGELHLLMRWLETIPESVLRSHPRLCAGYAWGLTLSGRLEVAEQWLDVIGAALATEPDQAEVRELTGRVSAIRAVISAHLRLEGDEAIRQANKALEHLHPSETAHRAIVLWSLGVAHYLKLEASAAVAALQDALAASLASGQVYTAVQSAISLSSALMARGELDEAQARSRQILGLTVEPGGFPVPITVYAHYWLAAQLLERLELEEALAEVYKGMPRQAESGDEVVLMHGYTPLAQILRALGRVEEARATLLEAARLATRYSASGLLFGVNIQLAELYRVQGALEEASAALESAWQRRKQGRKEGFASRLELVSAELCRARLLVWQGKQAEALPRVEAMLTPAEALELRWVQLERLVIYALAAQARGEEGPALSWAGQAAVLAVETGMLYTVVREGPRMEALLRSLIGLPDFEGAARRLLAYFDRRAGVWKEKAERTDSEQRADNKNESTVAPMAPGLESPSSSGPSGPVVSSPGLGGGKLILSPRELEILQCIADGLSNRDIGEELEISEGTAKWHVRHILSKLEARNRTEAVARARRLKLIP